MMIALSQAELTDSLAYAMVIAGAATFVGLMVLEAPYGRYSKSKGWGLQIPATYAWIVSRAIAVYRKNIVANVDCYAVYLTCADYGSA